MSEYNGLTKRQQYELRRSASLTERSGFESHWRQLAQFIAPRRTRFFTTDKNRGDKRNQSIIDSTASFGARTLQSGLHAGITSPARPWFKLSTPDPDLAEHGPVKEWLHQVTQRMASLFLRSNLYNAMPIVYGDMGVFATSAMAVVDDEHDFMRCFAYPVGSYALGVSERGVVDTFVREWQMTVRQIVETFGLIPGTRQIDWKRLSTAVKNAWDNSNYEMGVDVTWIVTPNSEYDPSKLDSKYQRFASCHFERGQEKDSTFLRESGFNEFPILAPRWDVTGAEDIYGTMSPAMLCLGDVKALQLMQKKKAQLVELGINPSLQAPNSVRNQKVSLLPGDISYADTTQQNAGIRPIREVNLNALQYLTADVRDTREMIYRAFYTDLFLMLAQSDQVQPITAREVQERHEEKLLALGPVLERTNDELLDPLVDRVYAMMERGGLIPPPPEELHGVTLKVEYTSIMAQAQKLVGVVGQDRFLQSVVPLTQVFPEVRYKIDAKQVVNDYGDMLGVNPKIVIPDDDAEAALQADKQAAQQQQQVEQEAVAAQSAQRLSQTPMDNDSALSRMLQGIQQ